MEEARVKEAAAVVRALRTSARAPLPGLPVLRVAALELRLDLPRVLRAKDTKRLAATGLTKEYVAALLRAFPDEASTRALDAAAHLFLCGLPARTVTALVDKHGHRAARVLADDPFGAMWDLGASLDDADACAKGAGMAPQARIAGHLGWHLRAAAKQGHTTLPLAVAESKIREMTGLDTGLIRGTIVASPTAVVVHGSATQACIVDSAVYAAERAIADHVTSRAAHAFWEDDLVAKVTGADNELSGDQVEALRTVCGAALSVLTGGPGTGKSSLVRHLVGALGPEACLLTAPTGRAARNVNGSTVHSASGGVRKMASLVGRPLVRRPIQETTSADVQQDLKLMVVDEASMLTTELMTAVFALAPPRCHIVLVGDPDQLPPIGPGNVLADLLATRACPVATLTTNHRSDATVHRLGRAVLEGDLAALTAALTPCPTPAASMRAAVAAVTAAPGEAQVLVPHNATRARYNRALQSALLPGGVKVAMGVAGWGVPVGRIGRLVTDGTGRSTLTFAAEAFATEDDQPKVLELDVDGALTLTKPLSREEGADHLVVGDAVMVLKNQNKRRVERGEVSACNGDIGVLLRAPGGLASATPLVEFEGGTSEFPRATGWLTLGYAVTVHKFQGSECERVVLPLDGTWDRTLLYTAVTRAKSGVTLLGTAGHLRAILDKRRPRRRGALAAILAAH